MPSSPENVLSFEEARRVVEEHARRLRPRGKELVPLADALGRVLAEPIAADRDFPPFPRATRDGYAVRASDVSQTAITLRVTGEIKAGAAAGEVSAEVAQGEAVSIMTGAPVPNGADAVVMVEYTSRDGDLARISRTVAIGENVVPAGAEARRGERLLGPGIRLDAPAIAVAASAGRARVLVHNSPRVAILSTGDEIVDADVLPGPTQIRNSNSYSLAAQVRACGGEPWVLPIAPDERGRLRSLIEECREADLMLLTGGVSMGKYDLVEQVLTDLGAEFFFTGAQIQPGRPIVFGRVPLPPVEPEAPARGHVYFFGLPGNPVSTMVTFELFARAAVEALSGASPRPLAFLHARLKKEIRTRTGLKRFLPAILSGEFEHAEVELAPWQGSGDIAALVRANCYLVIPPDRERIPAGEWMPVMMR